MVLADRYLRKVTWPPETGPGSMSDCGPEVVGHKQIDPKLLISEIIPLEDIQRGLNLLMAPNI